MTITRGDLAREKMVVFCNVNIMSISRVTMATKVNSVLLFMGCGKACDQTYDIRPWLIAFFFNPDLAIIHMEH